MPNWCNNQLAVRGPAPEVQRFKEQALGHSPWEASEGTAEIEPDPLNFHSLVPVPEELVKAGYNESAQLWEKAHWGCKWGADNTEIVEECGGYVAYAFDTAWSPPLEFLREVSRQCPRCHWC